MRIAIKAPYHHVFEAEVPNNLDVLQSLVGGHIELLEIENGIDIICNEMGAINGSFLNIEHAYPNCDYPCPLYGTLVFCSADNEDFTSLSDEQLEYVFEMCEREEGTKLSNKEIRKIIEESGLKHWQIADAIGIADTTFCKWLRYDIPADKEKKILDAIEQLRRDTK